VVTGMGLNESFPMGTPTALYCRHCNSRRMAHHGVLICRTCDGPIHLLKTKPRD
jgi:hypothetical protein